MPVTITDEMIERVARAIEATFEFNGWSGTRLPGTGSVDCTEVARVALDAVAPNTTDEMTERLAALAADALDVIGTRWDDWGDECCFSCCDDAWHTEERFTTPARSSDATVRTCGCACHRLRALARAEDALTNASD